MKNKASVSIYPANRFTDKSCESVNDVLTNECPLQILVNQKPFSVTMRTPGFEADLVRGLLLAENVYDNLALKSFRYQTTDIDKNGTVIQANVFLNEDEKGSSFDAKRSTTSVSSCGICGKEDLSAIELCGAPLTDTTAIFPQTISIMFETMAKEQEAFIHSGGCHASAAFTEEGEMLVLREDIGRHNAVDKVIGFLLNTHQIHKAKVILVSGRVSYEIVSKAYHAGIPILAAISAPSGLAVSTSESFGITLLGFCRGPKMTAYSHPSRIINTTK